MLKKSKFTGDIILGLHDAIVSQTGIIAGLGLTIANQKLTILTMVVAAAADALSMLSANYLATCANGKRNAVMAGLYTGGAYIATATLLIIPFVFCTQRIYAVVITILIASIIIFIFNFLTERKNWAHSFWKMIIICTFTSVAALGIGQISEYLLK